MPSRWLSVYWLLLFVPVSLGLAFANASPVLVFIAAALALIPLTHLLAHAIEDLAHGSSPALSAFLNASFGNAIEFLIAIFALRNGLVEVVQASIIGSIIMTSLLVIGLSMFFGGLRFKEQRFNTDSAGVASTMLLIAIAGLAMPGIYSYTLGKPPQELSLWVSGILGAIYLLSLVFIFITHKYLFVVARHVPEDKPRWSTRTAASMLVVSILAIAVESNLLVESIEPVTQSLHLSQTFIGLIVIAILTNIPELSSALSFARKGNIDLSLDIGMSSAIQIALFVVPILVFGSILLGEGQLTLVFSLFQLVSVVLAVMIVNYLSNDGVCNWLEGAQLVSVYLIIAAVFFFV